MNNSESRYRRANLFLASFTVLAVCYMVALPLIPKSYLWIDKYAGQQDRLQRMLDDPSYPAQDSIARSNRIIVPNMLLDTTVLSGSNSTMALDDSVWHWPQGGTPDKGGNTVLVGKRFTYGSPKEAFYFLDRLKPGDSIGLLWDGSLYRYIVTSTEVIAAPDQSLAKTVTSPTLTLYTSTMPWAPSERLVVTAKLRSKP